MYSSKCNSPTLIYENQWKYYETKEYEDVSDKTEIFNGSIGIVEAVNSERQEIVVNFQYIGKVLITRNILSQLELSYATTIHKSQGSQFKYVIVGIDFASYSLLTKELVYTAITRAVQYCKVEAQTNALRYAISQNAISNKQTYLVEAIRKLREPVF